MQKNLHYKNLEKMYLSAPCNDYYSPSLPHGFEGWGGGQDSGRNATGCPEGAVAMDAKPDFPVPPKTVKELAAALRGGEGDR